MGEAKGRPHDVDLSPRLGTGRLSLVQFLERYGIPLNAFSRHTTISAWAIRRGKKFVSDAGESDESDDGENQGR